MSKMTTVAAVLKIFKSHLLRNGVVLSLNLMEASGVIEMRIAEIVRFRYLRWGSLWLSWNSSNHILSQPASQIEAKLDGRHRDDMEIQIAKIVQFYPCGKPKPLQTKPDSEL